MRQLALSALVSVLYIAGELIPLFRTKSASCRRSYFAVRLGGLEDAAGATAGVAAGVVADARDGVDEGRSHRRCRAGGGEAAGIGHGQLRTTLQRRLRLQPRTQATVSALTDRKLLIGTLISP